MRTLEQWSQEVPIGLRRAHRTALAKLRALGERALQLARERARGGIKDSLRLQLADGQVQIGSDHPGAYALETGEPIRGNPYLAIPLTGTPRLESPRFDPLPLFTLRTPDGRLFLASRASGHLQVRWKLQQQVTPDHAPFLAPAVEEASRDFGSDVLDAMTAEVIR